METNNNIINSLKNKILSILNRHGIQKAALFGSYAKGNFTENSDVDILVYDVPKFIDLLDFVSIQQELEDELDKKVDLVEVQTLKKTIKEEILATQILL